MKVHLQRDKALMALGKCLERINDALETLERKTTNASHEAFIKDEVETTLDMYDPDLNDIKKVNYETDVQPVLLELRTIIGTWQENEPETDDEECQAVWGDIAEPGQSLTKGKK